MWGKKQKTIVTPLEDDAVQELHRLELEAFKLIGVSEKNSSVEIVAAMYNYVDKILDAGKSNVSSEEMDNVSISLASAWGLAVCREYNWEWKYLEIPKKTEKSYYILSPDHWYCCPPFYFITNILEGNNIGFDGKNDNTVLLLFNMIETLKEKMPSEKYYIIC